MTKTNVDPDSISWSSETDEKKSSVPQRVRDLGSETKTDGQERLSADGDGRLEDLLGASHNTDFVMEKVATISTEEARSILEGAIEYHEDDPNFPDKTMSKIKSLVKAFSLGEKDESSEFDLKFEAVLIGYISPYPEVRSVVDATDDVDIPVETIRAYFLGIVFIITICGVNQFFVTRQPKISISAAVIQLFLYPTGKILEKLLPDWGFVIRGTRYSLNPGPWSFKEQMLATCMMHGSISATNVSTNLIPVQHLNVFYGNKWAGIGFQLLVQFSSQYIGMGLAGTMRRWVVYPVRALWPTILPTIAMNRALLKAEKATTVHGWSISRYWFFWVVFAIAFGTYWIPGYLFTALGTFNWINWIAPNNFNLAVISGSTLGLGFNPITTFDWTVINHGFDPLSMPFYTALNQYSGLVLSAFAIIGMYWSNYKYTSYLPINTNVLRTNTGEPYSVQKILTNGLLDEKKYQKYSPPFYSAGALLDLGTNFVFYPLTITLIFLSEWRTVYESFKDTIKDLRNPLRSNYAKFHDVHSRMMARYKEVPDWWFYAVFLGGLGLTIASITSYPTRTSVPGIIIVLVISFICLIPISLLQSVTGYSFGIGTMTDMISGYLWPGNPSSMMIMRIYGNAIDSTAEAYIGNQKLAHYSKIPPRAMFRVQILGTLLQCLVTIGVLNWQMSNVGDLCSPTQPQRFRCASQRNFYAGSITWGAIGPKRMFDGMYPVLKYCFLMGFLLAFPFHLLKLKFRRYLRYVNPMLIIAGMSNWAPYNLSYFTPGIYVSFAFMFVIRRRYLGWWEKYNYILHSGLTAGVALAAVVIFFSVQYTSVQLSWWGNSVSSSGIDGGEGRQTLLPLPEVGYFGPPPGHFP
ncbi:OPT oligopeptide transporter protein-domain-containing protein [Lipomyces orientalis]|uniref:OPT oligopeptide transporter protein-domain-containing protein n=1 Tax=Lipomyces orientalis TaxID=1233043 RepID=A0ACC3TEY0_9ASCO